MKFLSAFMAVAEITTLGVWSMYWAGQLLHILLVASLTIKSSLPNGITSVTSYLRAKWIPLVCRMFLTTAAFMIVWDNPQMVNIQAYTHGILATSALAGLLGWFSDSVFDKVLSFIPALSGSLPKLDDKN